MFHNNLTSKAVDIKQQKSGHFFNFPVAKNIDTESTRNNKTIINNNIIKSN